MWNSRCSVLIVICALFLTTLLTVDVKTAYAASDFDGLIIPSNSLVMSGVDRTDTWYHDLKQYSVNHPSDMSLATAVQELNRVIYSGAGWSLLLCPTATCGTYNGAQVIVHPSSAHYKFFYDNYGQKSFGVPIDDATPIFFYYDSSGTMVAGANGVNAVGSIWNSDYSTRYFAFQYYSNTSIMTRTVSVNAPIDYPSGYDGTAAPYYPLPDYVAMGDSYSSGEGTEPFEPGTDTASNSCHRSEGAYPKLLGVNPSLRNIAFVACSGATTNDVLGISEEDDPSGKGGEPAQIDSLSNDTQVVTVTIGGNDIKFADFAKKCISPVSAVHLDDVCDEYTDIYDEVTGLISTSLPPKLEATYTSILENAPNAEIYVGGYPLIVPNKAISDPFDQDCGGLYDEAPNYWGDARAAYDVVNLLNAAIENAVNDVNVSKSSTRLHYVDVTSGAFVGHDICQSGSTSYFNGIDLFNPEYSIHPNYNGQAAYADDFEEAIS